MRKNSFLFHKLLFYALFFYNNLNHWIIKLPFTQPAVSEILTFTVAKDKKAAFSSRFFFDFTGSQPEEVKQRYGLTNFVV